VVIQIESGDIMNNQLNPPGKTTIAPEVLVAIARLTALSIPGVSRLSTTRRDVNQLLKRGFGVHEGVRIEVVDDSVYTDIYVVMQCDVNVRDVSRNIQSQVARAISDMVGMDVGKVNVHVEDIDYNTNQES
jgi:uncharacterized alkaline shock family protein YloU